jgi:hypothetical protein
MINPTTNLIELRQYYQNIVAQSEYKASQAKAQLEHIDALLVNGLLQVQAFPSLKTAKALSQESTPSESASPILVPSAQAEVPDDRTESELAEDVLKPLSPREATPVAETIAQGNRIPRLLLPEYQGLKRLEAIAKVLQSSPEQEVTIDSLIPALFGNLSTVEHKAEKKRLKTLLYQGEKLKLWQKGTTSSSYLMGAPQIIENIQPAVAKTPIQPKAKASSAKATVATIPRGRDSISLLPAYEGMNKLEAISQILSEQSGHVLHQDTITQLLYGDLSPEVLKVESRRMRASLFQGITKGLWQRAPKQPSSYQVKVSNGRKPKSATVASVPAKPGRKPSASTTVDSDRDHLTPTKTASRGRTQVLSLPAQYAGLSKIQAVSKVIEENAGVVMHMDEIIERLYGKLTKDDLKAEKVRMKDVMTRGVQRQLWSKAKGVRSSIVAGEPKQSSPEKKSTPKQTGQRRRRRSAVE